MTPTRNYVYHLGAGPQPGLTVDNNLVFTTWAEAGLVDTKTFMPSAKSPVRDAATGRVDYITKDHYNHDRLEGAAADVGAVEGLRSVAVHRDSENQQDYFQNFVLNYTEITRGCTK